MCKTRYKMSMYCRSNEFRLKMILTNLTAMRSLFPPSLKPTSQSIHFIYLNITLDSIYQMHNLSLDGLIMRTSFKSSPLKCIIEVVYGTLHTANIFFS